MAAMCKALQIVVSARLYKIFIKRLTVERRAVLMDGIDHRLDVVGVNIRQNTMP